MGSKTKSKSKTTRTKSKSAPKKVAKKNNTTASMPLKAISEKQTKVQIVRSVSDATGLSSKQVKEVFFAVSHLAKSHLIKKGSGEFTIPEIGIKLVRKTRPATKKRQGRNPLTGESITIPAKPKKEIIRARLLKSLKGILD